MSTMHVQLYVWIVLLWLSSFSYEEEIKLNAFLHIFRNQIFSDPFRKKFSNHNYDNYQNYQYELRHTAINLRYYIQNMRVQKVHRVQSTVYRVGGVPPAGIYSRYHNASQPLTQEEHHQNIYDDRKRKRKDLNLSRENIMHYLLLL